MLSHFTLTIVLFILSTMIACPNITLALDNYTPDQINEIIYHLYQVIQNSNLTEIGYSHDLAVLIDLICSNEFYENAVEACDIVTELPID